MTMHIPRIQWYPGHIAKVQPKLQQLVKLVDLIVEVLDARLPSSSHFALADKLAAHKSRVLVLNKVDLADPQALAPWIRAWEARGFRVERLTTTTDKGLQQLKGVLADEARVLNGRLAKKGILPRPLRLMILGLPNVGKSTIINRLTKRRSAQTGDKPGVTRGTQWVRVAKGLELLDTPGLIPPRLDDPELALKLALVGAVSTEAYDPLEVARVAMRYLDAKRPGYLAGIGEPATIEAYAQQRGFLLPGGHADVNRTAKTFLLDLRDGRFGPLCLDDPPEGEKADDGAAEAAPSSAGS